MDLHRVLIVHKRSAYETYFNGFRSARLKRLAKAGDPGLAHIRRAHDAHYETLRSVEKALSRRGILYCRQFRGVPFDERRWDLILSVGGDGTFLDAAHWMRNGPLLGLNSDTRHSVGRLCSTDRGGFEKALGALRAGRFRVIKLNRLRFTRNGREFMRPVLNDALICHACPAAMSHYVLQCGGVRERQRSSGLWVSTAAGSTGAMLSTGGRAMPIESARIQYRPREPFEGHGAKYRLRGGVLGADARITFVSQMEAGLVFADGHHTPVALKYGDRLEITRSPLPVLSVRAR